ncbi:MAG: hypothetical protein AB1478_09505 [Nitrospirota bacterium]
MGVKNKTRIISDPYLAAFLFLKLKVKPSPVVDDSGKVSFVFPDDKHTDEAVERFYKGETVSAFTYSGAIKAVKSIIFALRSKGRDSSREVPNG